MRGLERPMDYIERLFGISPDGGNGLLELSIFLLFVVVVVGLLLRRMRARSVRDVE